MKSRPWSGAQWALEAGWPSASSLLWETGLANRSGAAAALWLDGVAAVPSGTFG
eukprot:CAMPEP_0115885890 /NCGR_PEP_ID=MMETSP0287-20121206/30917_1 /TAXON_ID=412157 /ORGANISM="Chrysochromulina rotalis, Strain UIO044" /LENGTH=53 /DNA_ID=CAMNT_0003342341 /DNA_START=448 /DNA_END=612 /DNA_ORIENTATION=-